MSLSTTDPPSEEKKKLHLHGKCQAHLNNIHATFVVSAKENTQVEKSSRQCRHGNQYHLFCLLTSDILLKRGSRK